MWWLAGITRDVYLYSRPSLHVRDFAVRTRIDAVGDGFGAGLVEVELELLRAPPPASAAAAGAEGGGGAGCGGAAASWAEEETLPAASVELELLPRRRAQPELRPGHLQGTSVTRPRRVHRRAQPELHPAHQGTDLAAPPVAAARVSAPLCRAGGKVGALVRAALRVPAGQALPWSAETPSLYTLLLTLRDAAGSVVEVLAQRVGERCLDAEHRPLHVPTNIREDAWRRQPSVEVVIALVAVSCSRGAAVSAS